MAKKRKQVSADNANAVNNQILDKLRQELHPEHTDFQVKLEPETQSINVSVKDKHNYTYRVCNGKVTWATINDVPRDISPGWPLS